MYFIPAILFIKANPSSEDSMISMYVGEHQANKTYADYTGHHLAKVIINEAGYGDLLVHGQSVSIWVEDNQ